MFTGIIEAKGIVKAFRGASGGRAVLTVDIGPLAEGVKPGDSIAVNGTCLTVSKLDGAGGRAEFDVSGQTLETTTIASLKPSQYVNLERAMAADGRFGGHIVQGHIDGTGKVTAIIKHGNSTKIKFSAAANLIDNMVPKCSVAVDGISLTAADVEESSFEVAVIPTTLDETTLGQVKVGDSVNIETDIIAKVVKKQVAKILSAGKGLTIDKLKDMGF